MPIGQTLEGNPRFNEREERSELDEAAAIIVRAMVEYAEAMNMPPEFVRGIRADTRSDTVTIHNDWVRPADKYGPPVPLGDIFENGSKDHWIKVKYELALHWDSWEGVSVVSTPRGPEAYPLHKDNYAKQIFVSGIKGFKPMKRGWRTGKRRVRSWLKSKKEYDEWQAGFRSRIRLKETEIHEWNPRWNPRHMMDQYNARMSEHE